MQTTAFVIKQPYSVHLCSLDHYCKHMHALILGPTGTAGSEVLNQALAHNDITRVTVLHRRSTGITHTKLDEIMHSDFTEYLGLEKVFASVDVCFFCLGISQMKERNWDRFFKISHDFPVSLAKALMAQNPDVKFCFLSGQGADPTGMSKLAFAKAKGAAETSLRKLGLKHLYIFRPGYIHPDKSNPGRTIGERISGFLFPVLRFIIPQFVIRAKVLAIGMIQVGLHGYPEVLLDNQMIKKAANSVGD